MSDNPTLYFHRHLYQDYIYLGLDIYHNIQSTNLSNASSQSSPAALSPPILERISCAAFLQASLCRVFSRLSWIWLSLKFARARCPVASGMLVDMVMASERRVL